MKFDLAGYQADAIEGVLGAFSKARTGYLEDGEKTAIGLTAPTGAGKTVIATGVLEGLVLRHWDSGAEPRDDGPVGH